MISSNKFVFRLIFLLVLLSIVKIPFNILTHFFFVDNLAAQLHTDFVNWVLQNIFSIDEQLAPLSKFNRGSGDSTYDYIHTFILAVLAFFIAVVWSILSRKNIYSYKKLNDWFVVFLRYYIVSVLISYGFAKIFPLQFPEPTFNRLLQPYGESSLVGLLWTFFGVSRVTLFIRIIEVLGALLVLFRRTKVIGAIILNIVLLGVFISNLCYDVPVKIYSLELLLISIVSLLTDKKRWRYLAIEVDKYVQVFGMNMKRDFYRYQIDPLKKTLRLIHFKDSTEIFLNYMNKQNSLIVKGYIKSDSIYANFKKYSKEDFLLLGRGFHWINENPHNK